MLLLTSLPAPAQQGDPAGKVTFLEGYAWVEDGLARRPLGRNPAAPAALINSGDADQFGGQYT